MKLSYECSCILLICKISFIANCFAAYTNSKNLDKQNMDGDSAMHICARYNQPECMRLLLRSGCKWNAENRDGRTPLDIAREKGFRMCEELVSFEIHLFCLNMFSSYA